MDAKEKATNKELEALKVVSTQRLLGMLEAACRNGTLKPVSSTATPIVQKIRVKSK